MKDLRKPELRRQSGQVLVLMAVALPLFFAICLLVIDGSRLFVEKRSAQNAADALSLAAAQELPDSGQCADGTPCATELTSTSFWDTFAVHNGAPATKTHLTRCTGPSDTDWCFETPYGGSDAKIQVRVKRDADTFFGGVVSALVGPVSNFHPVARAVAALAVDGSSAPFGGSFMYSRGDFTVSGGSNLLQEAIISDGNFTQSGGNAQVQASATVVSVKGDMSVSNWVGMGPAPPPTLISPLQLTNDPTTPWNDETVARVTSTASFPTSAIGGGVTIAGMIFVDDEYMTYDSVGTSAAACGTPFTSGQGCFIGLGRGFIPTRPEAAHLVGAAVDGRMARVAVKGSCNGAPACPTTTGGGVHAIDLTNGLSANVIDMTPYLPTFDVADARNNAALGPAHLPLASSPSCPFNLTTTTDPYWKNTTYSLTPTSSYTCLGSGGSISGAPTTAELSWNNTTKELKVRGVVYLPGNATVTQDAYYTTYDGSQSSATLYVAGTFNYSNINFCGLRIVASTDCDTRTWNPNTGHHLAIVSPTLPRGPGYTTQPSHTITGGGSARIQGFLYTDGQFTRSGGTGYVSGTVIAQTISTSGGASAAPAPGIFSLPLGLGGPTTRKIALAE